MQSNQNVAFKITQLKDTQSKLNSSVDLSTAVSVGYKVLKENQSKF